MIWLYTGFIVFVFMMMALELRVARHREREISTGQALAWTGLCILLALGFIPTLYLLYDKHWMGIGLTDGGEAGLSGFSAASFFLQGWLLEYSLSVDNLFVFALIFRHFKVPSAYQQRVLVWGIIGALLLRGAMIGLGTVLIQRFHWLLYIAGAFLVYTAFAMLIRKDRDFDPESSLAVRAARTLVPVSASFHGDRFAVRDPQTGRRSFTPLILVLVVVSVVDIIFAVDSIPAIFTVTTDPFIVFTSNVFAILGLRSLYFVLAHMLHAFRFLNISLAIVLGFVGGKMLLEMADVRTPTEVSLTVIVLALGLGIFFSTRHPGEDSAEPLPTRTPEEASEARSIDESLGAQDKDD
jgi:tellurite resistance protein TerC